MSILQMYKSKHKALKQLAQGHIASKWQNVDINPTLYSACN